MAAKLTFLRVLYVFENVDTLSFIPEALRKFSLGNKAGSGFLGQINYPIPAVWHSLCSQKRTPIPVKNQ